MADIVDLLLIIVGGIIAILGGVTATLINNRSMERMKRIELFHKRQEEAMAKLYEIASREYNTYDGLEKKLLSGMYDSVYSLYLPDKVVKGIFKHYPLSEEEKKKIPEKDRI
ncbi:unnamed protein product, partial [marine sediment metagenome]